jgi:uncharacterized RDD family membrane protein YckC
MKCTLSKNLITILFLASSLFAVGAFPAQVVLAQDGLVKSQAKVELENPLRVTTIEGLLRAIIAVVLVFAVPIIIFFIIYAGFLYVTARGNEQQVQQATRALLYALVGGLLILGAYVLIQIIANLIAAIAG